MTMDEEHLGTRSGGQHQETLLLHRKLTGRARAIICIFFTPLSILYSIVRTSSTSVSAAHRILQIVTVTLPYALTVLIAACLPEGVPGGMSLRSSAYVALLICVPAACDMKYAYDALHFVEYPIHVRMVRSLVSATYALGSALLALDMLRSRAKRSWASCRVFITACGSVRLGAILMLWALGAPADCYPPGRSSFGFALLFSILCVALGTIGLAPPWRKGLSEWTGLSRVTLTLAEVPHLRGERREARRQEAADGGSDPGRSRLHRKPFDHSSSSSSSSNRDHQQGMQQSGRGGGERGTLFGGIPSSEFIAIADARDVGASGRIVHAHHFSGSTGNNRHRWQARRITMYPEDFARLRAEGQRLEGGGQS